MKNINFDKLHFILTQVIFLTCAKIWTHANFMDPRQPRPPTPFFLTHAYFRKKLRLRYLGGFWIQFWYNTKYNTKFSKGRSEHCKRKQKRNEFDEGNAGTWVRILSFIYSWQGIEATVRNIIMNKIPAQVFFGESGYTLWIEHLRVTAFKEM